MTVSSTLTRLTLKQLRYFNEVAKLGSISEAAEKLALSQPPLTMAMRNLGDILGVTLFERDGRGIRLTPASVELLQGTDQVFELLERVCQRVRTADESGIARMTIGITDDFVCSPLIPDLMNVKQDDVTLVVNTIISSTGAMLLRQVLDGTIDIALMVASPDGYPKGLVTRRLPSARIMALVSREHDLAAKPVLRPRDMSKEQMLLMPEKSSAPFAHQCTKIFRNAGVKPHRANEVVSAAITQSLVEANVGIGLVSEFSVRDSSESVRVPLESRHARLRLTLVHKRKPRSEYVPILARSIAQMSGQTG